VPAKGIDSLDRSYYTARMAMGKRKRHRDTAIWISTSDLPTAPSHPFYTRLNQVLREAEFEYVRRAWLPPVLCAAPRAARIVTNRG